MRVVQKMLADQTLEKASSLKVFSDPCRIPI